MLSPIVIVGSGLAGYMVAKEFRKYDTHTPLEIFTTHDGCFYSKPMLSNALTQKKIPENLMLTDAVSMEKQLNAKIYSYTEVMHIDSKARVLSFDNQLIKNVERHYSQLVFACGARKLQPQFEGDVAHDQIMSINNLEDYRLFFRWLNNKKDIAILGAGLLSVELANDLLNAGYRVHVISPDAYPLLRLLPEELALSFRDILAAQGVQWHFNRSVQVIQKSQEKLEIIFSDQGRIVVDGILSAVGIAPEIHLAKKANIAVNLGIAVDAYLRTSAPGLYALGDCAEVVGTIKPHVAPLLIGARVLAKNLAGMQEKVEYPPMPVVVKTPACPIISLLPENPFSGEWKIEGEGANYRALFYNPDAQLTGFVLMGELIKEKNQWLMRCVSRSLT